VVLYRNTPFSDAQTALSMLAPEYRFRNNPWLIPALTSRGRVTEPILTWWLVLFTLSILARYHPDLWSRLLDYNRSEVAATIAHGLDEALVVVPHLVLEVVSRPNVNSRSRILFHP
jgi:hypothetical protein